MRVRPTTSHPPREHEQFVTTRDRFGVLIPILRHSGEEAPEVMREQCFNNQIRNTNFLSEPLRQQEGASPERVSNLTWIKIDDKISPKEQFDLLKQGLKTLPTTLLKVSEESHRFVRSKVSVEDWKTPFSQSPWLFTAGAFGIGLLYAILTRGLSFKHPVHLTFLGVILIIFYGLLLFAIFRIARSAFIRKRVGAPYWRLIGRLSVALLGIFLFASVIWGSIESVNHMQKSTNKLLTTIDSRALELALEHYEMNYGLKLPPSGKEFGEVDEPVLLTDELIDVLVRENFLFTSTLPFVDTWGTPFVIIPDYDYDEIVTHPVTGQKFAKNYLIFSAGEDQFFGFDVGDTRYQGSTENTADNISLFEE